MDQIFRDVINGPTQDTMYDMGEKDEIYYWSITTYMGRYLWQIEDYAPKGDAELWNMFREHTQRNTTTP